MEKIDSAKLRAATVFYTEEALNANAITAEKIAIRPMTEDEKEYWRVLLQGAPNITPITASKIAAGSITASYGTSISTAEIAPLVVTRSNIDGRV